MIKQFLLANIEGHIDERRTEFLTLEPTLPPSVANFIKDELESRREILINAVKEGEIQTSQDLKNKFDLLDQQAILAAAEWKKSISGGSKNKC